MRQTFERILTSGWLPLLLAALAILLVLPSLWSGWQLDDVVHRYFLLGNQDFQGRAWSPLDLFSFLEGDSVRTHGMMDLGLLPWWTVDRLRLSFWRPLAGLTHWLDYRLWPDSAFLMHVQSLFWFGSLIAVVVLLYRRFLGFTWAAGLAALFYAIDDARGLPAGWLAARNIVLAALFGMLAILFHDMWRRSGFRAGVFLGPLCLALGLLSGESALGVTGWLIAYAATLDPATLRGRLASLVPYGVLTLLWMVAYAHGGHGTWGSGFYVDPLHEPLQFLRAFLQRAPILLLDQFGFPPSFIVMAMSDRQLAVLWIWAMLLIVLLAIVFVPLIRNNRTARFWTLGLILSLPFLCATMPHGRLLSFAGLGGMGLVAQWLVSLAGKEAWLPAGTSWRRLARCMRVFLVGVHAVVAPLLLPWMSLSASAAEPYLQRAALTIPAGPEITRKDLVLVNPPVVFYATHLSAVRIPAGEPVPRVLRILAPGTTSLRITRAGPRELTIRPRDGFVSQPFDNLYRGPGNPMTPGQRVELSRMTAVVNDVTDDGRPDKVTFEFSVPLESDTLVWLQWGGDRYLRFSPPSVGDTIEIPAAQLGF